jgi:hypothetical protein
LHPLTTFATAGEAIDNVLLKAVLEPRSSTETLPPTGSTRSVPMAGTASELSSRPRTLWHKTRTGVIVRTPRYVKRTAQPPTACRKWQVHAAQRSCDSAED